MPFAVPVSAHFTTQPSMQVTGEGIHIYVMPEEKAYIGESYYIQFAVANESSRTYYNFGTSFGHYEQPDQEYRVTDLTAGEVYEETMGNVMVADPTTMSQSVVVHDGQKISFSILRLGDYYYGTYKTTFSGEGDPDEYYYELVNHLVETISGANLGVEVTVSPVPSHFGDYGKAGGQNV